MSVRLVAILLSVVLVLGCGELTAGLYYYVSDGKWRSVPDRLGLGIGDYVVSQALVQPGSEEEGRPGCRWVDMLYPHPYLAFAGNPIPPCNLLFGNSIGMAGREFPLRKDESAFYVLLTGGSVAMLLGQVHEGYPFYLEDALNKCFVPPHGERFVVLNGAFGDWKHPQQEIIFLLYGDVFDAVISVEGANEYGAVVTQIPTRMDKPDNRFLDVSGFSQRSYRQTAALWLGNQTLVFLNSHWLTRNSFLSYFVADHLVLAPLRGIVEGSGDDSKTLDTLFALPKSWSMESRVQFNLELYKRYLRNLHDLATANGKQMASFIQPVPAYGKVLTDFEQRVTADTNHWKQKALNYLQMTDSLMSLQKEGVPVHDLTNLFKDIPRTIYADPIHYIINKPGGGSPGHQVMAAAIAYQVGKDWKLASKPGCKGPPDLVKIATEADVVSSPTSAPSSKVGVDSEKGVPFGQGQAVNLDYSEKTTSLEGVQVSPAAGLADGSRAMLVSEDISTGWHRLNFERSATRIASSSFAITVKRAHGSKLFWDFYDDEGKYLGFALVDLRDGTIIPYSPNILRASSQVLGDEWLRFDVTTNKPLGPEARFSIGIADPKSGRRAEFKGENVKGFYLYRAERR